MYYDGSHKVHSVKAGQRKMVLCSAGATLENCNQIFCCRNPEGEKDAKPALSILTEMFFVLYTLFFAGFEYSSRKWKKLEKNLHKFNWTEIPPGDIIKML